MKEFFKTCLDMLLFLAVLTLINWGVGSSIIWAFFSTANITFGLQHASALALLIYALRLFYHFIIFDKTRYEQLQAQSELNKLLYEKTCAYLLALTLYSGNKLEFPSYFIKIAEEGNCVLTLSQADGKEILRVREKEEYKNMIATKTLNWEEVKVNGESNESSVCRRANRDFTE